VSGPAVVADFLARLEACPGLAGVLARRDGDPDWVHVYDPDGWAWHLLPAVDLPLWVRKAAPRRWGVRSRPPTRRRARPRCPGCHCHALLPIVFAAPQRDPA
jgi:hypothetical protein